MRKPHLLLMTSFLLTSLFMVACGAPSTPVIPTQPGPPTDQPLPATAAPVELPEITSVELDRSELPRYESLELTLTVQAEYDNPFDARQVRLEGEFSGPEGVTMNVPGFWDGKESWRLRFTPSKEGQWTYRLTIADSRGVSLPTEGEFSVMSSELHGWLQVGSWVDPAWSEHYLVTHNGTPFYGLGHCDPLNIFADGFAIEDGVGLFDDMLAAGENFVVWWPQYTNSPINNHYDQYSLVSLNLIDLVVKDAQKKGIYLIFTIWDHPELRALGHPWGPGKWESNNGFRELGFL